MAKHTGGSILGAVASVAAGGRVKGKYDESKHRRGAGGKFASKGLGPKTPAVKKTSAKSTVYDLADKMRGASKKEVLAAAKAAGVNDSTAANHYHYWQKRQVQLLAAKKLGPDPVAALKKMDDPRAEMKKIAGEALGIKKPSAPADADKSLTKNQQLMAKHQKTLDDPNAAPEAKKKAANNVKYYANAHKKEQAGKTTPKADPKPEPVKTPPKPELKPEPKPESKPELKKELTGTQKLIAKHQATLDDPNASPEAKKKAANNVKYYQNQQAKEGGKPKAAQPDNQTKANQDPAPDKAQKAADKAQKEAEKAQKAADKAYKADQKQKMAAYVSKMPYYSQKDFPKKVKLYQEQQVNNATQGKSSSSGTDNFELQIKNFAEKNGIPPDQVPDFKLPQSQVDELVAKHKVAKAETEAAVKLMSEQKLQQQIAAKKLERQKLGLTPEKTAQNRAEFEQLNSANGVRLGEESPDTLKKIRDRAGVTYNYTSSAVRSYTGSGYESINSNLRAGDPPGAKAKELDKLIKGSSFKEDTIMWRGVGSGGTIFNGSPPPVELVDNGFTSVSFKPSVAQGFSDGKTLFRVRIPAGFPGLNIAMGTPTNPNDGLLHGEAEVLLPRGTTYKVVRRHLMQGPANWGGKHMDVVDLEPVLPPGYPNY